MNVISDCLKTIHISLHVTYNREKLSLVFVLDHLVLFIGLMSWFEGRDFCLSACLTLNLCLSACLTLMSGLVYDTS
jgi:hypothetical protein